jgi:ribose 5-phosphate isomerase RpiB
MAIADAAAKGQAKLARKATQMAASYNAAKGRMVTGYQGAGFGPTRTANYQSGVQAANYHAPDANKWARNWSAKMAE